ncbi:MAG: hypothetical protein EOO60_03140 [Hymenobacter sp.]|nr:MAG: hypothetical protein EOO60_03140 [Hymenobacter sp.]
MLPINQEEFFTSLQITQAYCAQQLLQPWRSDLLALRTSLQPVYQNQQWFITPLSAEVESGMTTLAEWLRTSDPYQPTRFAEVFAHQLAHKTSIIAELARQAFYPGRILVVEYDLNIPDGR